MSTSGRIAGFAAKLAGVAAVGLVAPAAAAGVVAGPATAAVVVADAAAAGAAGPDILGAAVSVAARWPGFLARSLWRTPVGGVESSRFFARDLFSLAPDRTLRAMWATLAPLPAPATTTPMSELVNLVNGRRGARCVARTWKRTYELLEWLHAEHRICSHFLM